MPQEPQPSSAEIARVFESVLSDPEFSPSRPRPAALLAEWFAERVWRPIAEFLDGFFGRMPEGSSLVATVVLFAVVAWAGWRVASGWMASRRRRREAEGEDGGPESVRGPEDWRRVAAARAAEGRYRSAATALYMETVARLHAAGAVIFHASKTPGEYAREVARNDRPGRGAGVAGARQFLGAFQALAFGRASPTAEAYRELEGCAPRWKERMDGPDGPA